MCPLRRARSPAGGLRGDEVEALSRRVVEMQQLILLVKLAFEAHCSDYARDILRNSQLPGPSFMLTHSVWRASLQTTSGIERLGNLYRNRPARWSSYC